ncbi:MAG: CDP-glycerol glycerophosphotransferase family protein [Pseudomonadales bacterium]|nr:CDP-glycerol glycerophosphotransferase family protein [Pseudomonadales bacterium]
MFSFFRHIKNLIDFTQLDRSQKRIVFYSEGKNYWVHLEGMVRAVLENSDIPVCYVSSSVADPGLALSHPNYHVFEIDESFVRNWLFENMQADVLVMSMPDLQQYQVKRSKFDVHYVYVQHSLVSLHMVYREGAFDFFDTIFCAGPHHLKELRSLEEKYNLPKKQLVNHGYARLDAILKEAENHKNRVTPQGEPIHVLVAPSWGPNSIVESGVGKAIIAQLLSNGFKVTFRPHPQTTKFAKTQVDDIVKSHQRAALFHFEDNVAGQNSLHQSDVMICDWSGAALDYAFGLNKPVLFIDVPRKINNPRYQDIDIEPLEVGIRPIIGDVLSVNDISSCSSRIAALCEENLLYDKSNYVFNSGKSNEAGFTALMKIVANV